MIVTLHDGRAVPSDHDDWKVECLARHVLAMPGLRRRREFLEAIEKEHGARAADRLRGVMKALHESRRVAA